MSGRTIFCSASFLRHSSASLYPFTERPKPATHENAGFSHLGQAYNARKGSTYTHAAMAAASL
jgi:hypothetical protein